VADRRFRFVAGGLDMTTPRLWSEAARGVESLGYSALAVNDHLGPHGPALDPMLALAAAAEATSTLRLGTMMLNAGLRHPAQIAREAATLDVLSGGRVELGLGAGNYETDYRTLGRALEPAAARIERLGEAVRIIKGLWAEELFSHAGRHYSVDGLEGRPRPVQRPRPPLVLGGGGRRMLTLAAREADIVSLAGGTSAADLGEERLAERVGWIREAAGERFEDIELQMLLPITIVTADRLAAAQALFDSAGPSLGFSSAEEILAAPHIAIGTGDEIADRLVAIRDAHSISCFAVWGPSVGPFAEVVLALSGT
jgi:probable F420-dependent oxidoreductase